MIDRNNMKLPLWDVFFSAVLSRFILLVVHCQQLRQNFVGLPYDWSGKILQRHSFWTWLGIKIWVDSHYWVLKQNTLEGEDELMQRCKLWHAESHKYICRPWYLSFIDWIDIKNLGYPRFSSFVLAAAMGGTQKHKRQHFLIICLSYLWRCWPCAVS